jgi:hypothetical protein
VPRVDVLAPEPTLPRLKTLRPKPLRRKPGLTLVAAPAPNASFVIALETAPTFYDDEGSVSPMAAMKGPERALMYPTVTRLVLVTLVLLAIAALFGGWAWDDMRSAL